MLKASGSDQIILRCLVIKAQDLLAMDSVGFIDDFALPTTSV